MVSAPVQVADFFARLVQRVAPKHYAQAMAEVTVTRLFLENFSGDQVPRAADGPLSHQYALRRALPTVAACERLQMKLNPLSSVMQVRFLARSFGVPGDHAGQTSHGYRWPFGPVGIVTPFNFPLEIPALQLMGALYMGNKPLLHVDRRCTLA